MPALISYIFQAIIYWLSQPRAGFVTRVVYYDDVSQTRSWQGLASLSRFSLGASFGDKPVKVRFYRRPLNTMISALTNAGFALEKIIEPRPTEECKQLYPQDYEKLSTKPWFLIILARNK